MRSFDLNCFEIRLKLANTSHDALEREEEKQRQSGEEVGKRRKKKRVR